MPVRNLLLRSLGSAISELAPHLRATTFRAGEHLNEPLERVQRVHFPVAGVISARAVLENGHEVECVLVGHTNALGGVSAINSDLSMTRDVCLTETRAWTINLHRLRIAMAENRLIESQVKRFSFAQLGYAIQMGVCNATHSAEPRLARWLATAADLLKECDIPIAQDELAKVLGVQRSALNPLLRKLKTQGLVELRRGKITILDRENLDRRACECRHYLKRAAQMDATPADYGSDDAPFGL